MVRFDGNTPEDIKLWHTYLYWARQRAKMGLPPANVTNPAIADDPANRIEDSLSNALQTILFSSFALEYRLKRVLVSMGVALNSKETLGPLLQNFWKRLSRVDRLDGKGKCMPPTEWNNCMQKLQFLASLRNDIAHANYHDTLARFTGTLDPHEVARRHYNAVVDSLRLINVGTGYEARPAEVVDEYFRPLRVGAE